MKIRFKPEYLVGIGIGILMIMFDVLVLWKTRWFWAFLILSLVVITFQFWLDLFNEHKRQKEIELKFLEFVRHLVETVKSGIPIPQAILIISDKDYGALTPHIRKLANHIMWGIPIHKALFNFAKYTGNKVIKRSISIVIEAEASGGEMEDVLVSVTNSVVQVKNLKEEQKSQTYSQVVQGYIVFFAFIGIMLLMQLKLFPNLLDMSGSLVGGFGGGLGVEKATESLAQLDLDKLFVGLILIQGFFAGLVIGKFSEGEFKYGIKHSLVLVTLGLLLITTIKGSLF